MHDAVQTDLDFRVNLLIVGKFGQELEVTEKYRLLYSYSEAILGYTYVVQNISQRLL